MLQKIWLHWNVNLVSSVVPQTFFSGLSTGRLLQFIPRLTMKDIILNKYPIIYWNSLLQSSGLCTEKTAHLMQCPGGLGGRALPAPAEHNVLRTSAFSTSFVQGSGLYKVLLRKMPRKRKGYKGRDWKTGKSDWPEVFVVVVLLINSIALFDLLCCWEGFIGHFCVLFLPSHTSHLHTIKSIWAKFSSYLRHYNTEGTVQKTPQFFQTYISATEKDLNHVI